MKSKFGSISTVKPLWTSGKTFAANAGGRGFESHREQNLFFTFYIVGGVRRSLTQALTLLEARVTSDRRKHTEK